MLGVDMVGGWVGREDAAGFQDFISKIDGVETRTLLLTVGGVGFEQ